MTEAESAADSRLKIGDRVMIEYPGYALHKRMATVTGVADDDFLGALYILAIDGVPPVALTASCLRPIVKEEAAA